RFLGGVFHADTSGISLCHSGRDEAVAGGDMRPFMQTDGENLMHAGVTVGGKAFERFLTRMEWTRDDLQKTICHQIGVTHRRFMLKKLGLEETLDFSTVETLGNTGSAALPITAAIAAERGRIVTDDQIAFLGIGSGINSLMLGFRWARTLVNDYDSAAASSPAELAEQSGQ
ncbi:MAG: hypothetical protein N2C14_07280, partial [Planctomycetales bacterium]